jgi:hypothetical protein
MKGRTPVFWYVILRLCATRPSKTYEGMWRLHLQGSVVHEECPKVLGSVNLVNGIIL